MMNEQLVEMGWTHEYEARVLAGLPGDGGEVLDFRATSHGRGREGLVVQLRQGSDASVGNFQRGDGKLSGIYATPSPDHLCVVAAGTAYWVLVRVPACYEIVQAYPVQAVLSIIELRLIIFVDFTIVAAYGASGLRWKSERVSWDGIKILCADGRGIWGRGWDAAEKRETGFFIDAATGDIEGGAAPPISD